MSTTLFALRHTAKEILAAAVLELFPSTLLIGGECDSLGFYYDFFLPKKITTLFSQRELDSIEDQMVRLIQEDKAIKATEMMRENAAHYLNHLGQTVRAESTLDSSQNIVSIVQIGSFLDASEPPCLSSTKELKAFKLQGFKNIPEGIVRIYGTAFFDKGSLKSFLKQYSQALKNDPEVLGMKKGYFLNIHNQRVLLGRGEQLLWELVNYWRLCHLVEGFQVLSLPSGSEVEALQLEIMKSKNFTMVASLLVEEGDKASILCSEQEVVEQLISSLHFINKAFKIFPFEPRVYCIHQRPDFLTRALDQCGMAYTEEKNSVEEARIEFRLSDGYGRENLLSSIRWDREGGVIRRSFYHSLDHWIILCIEKGVNKLEFANQSTNTRT